MLPCVENISITHDIGTILPNTYVATQKLRKIGNIKTPLKKLVHITKLVFNTVTKS